MKQFIPSDLAIAHYAARGMRDMGICGYEEAKRRYAAWLEKHDFEVIELFGDH
jgi:hypothetical protein